MKAQFTALFYLFSLSWSVAQWSYPSNTDWAEIQQVSQIDQRLGLVVEKARHFYYVEQDWVMADSVIRVPLSWNLSGASSAEAYYHALGEYGNLKSNFDQVNRHFSDTEFKSAQFQNWWYAWLEIKHLQKLFDAETGLERVYGLIKSAESIPDSSYKGLAYKEKAKLHEIDNNKIDALRYFLLARDVLAKTNAYEWMYWNNKELVFFYISVGLYDEAVATSSAGFAILYQLPNPDSIHYHEAVFSKHYSVYSHPEEFNGLEVIEERIKWTRKKGIYLILRYYTSVLRTYYIGNGEFEKLKDFYINKYPVAFQELEQENLPLYLRLRAYFHEMDGEIDSANYYWQRNLEQYQQIDDPVKHANMQYRHAEFLIRHNNPDQAKYHLHQAILLDQAGNDLIIQQNSVQKLQEIFFDQLILDSAFFYLQRYHLLKDSISNMNEKDKLVLAEVLHQTNARQREQEEKMRIQEIKISGFAVGFMLFLILSTITFYQYRLTNKERKRSDQLLLNILPESTAEELKEFGKTTAKKYTGATVLFADFVGFTHVAELLQPSQLVEEIDRYFSAFDDIMNANGLEKIKTIGDAYMAVAGLPEGNTASALDAVRAAISMIQVVQDLNKNNPKTPALQLRIGLHTGVVVAGVVGTNKFQYDIWGDAVNTAARMEQSGAPDHINISSETYKQVQHEIPCTHRGKIFAKNKGELDMYFVDLPVKLV